jgi:hypothetical protein
VGAMNATCRPFSIANQRREQRDDRLAGADIALQQPVHRLRTLHVVDDFLEASF